MNLNDIKVFKEEAQATLKVFEICNFIDVSIRATKKSLQDTSFFVSMINMKSLWNVLLSINDEEQKKKQIDIQGYYLLEIL